MLVMFPELDYENPSINVYLKYEFLSVSELSGLLKAIDNVVFDVVKIYNPPKHSFIEDAPGYLCPLLCIESINTGNSIKFSIGFDKKRFKVRVIPDTNELEIIVPSWSIIIILSALLLSKGLDITKTALEIQNMTKSSKEVKQALTSEDIERLKDFNNPSVNALNIHLHQFQQVINKKNITYVEINNYIRKGKSEDENK